MSREEASLKLCCHRVQDASYSAHLPSVPSTCPQKRGTVLDHAVISRDRKPRPSHEMADQRSFVQRLDQFRAEKVPRLGSTQVSSEHRPPSDVKDTQQGRDIRFSS
jgi:hypothetical protein